MDVPLLIRPIGGDREAAHLDLGRSQTASAPLIPAADQHRKSWSPVGPLVGGNRWPPMKRMVVPWTLPFPSHLVVVSSSHLSPDNLFRQKGPSGSAALLGWPCSTTARGGCPNCALLLSYQSPRSGVPDYNGLWWRIPAAGSRDLGNGNPDPRSLGARVFVGFVLFRLLANVEFPLRRVIFHVNVS